MPTLTKTIFDTEDYYDEEMDYQDVAFYLGETLENHISRYSTEKRDWVILSKRSSRYGSICNNGATGYKKVLNRTLEDAVLSGNFDRIIAKEVDGVLCVDYMDHDGTHHGQLKSLSKVNSDKLERLEDYFDFDDVIEFVKELPYVKVKKA